VNRSIAIVSGYFNPLHVGHLRMMHGARGLADRLVVIVNNDHQQIIKKGRIIIGEADRMEVVENLRVVDESILSIDMDGSVQATLAEIRRSYPDERLIFANGGDRKDPSSISEAKLCARLGIEVVFGVGGDDKADASSRIINEANL